jgi:hypothetical protein
MSDAIQLSAIYAAHIAQVKIRIRVGSTVYKVLL